MESSFTVCFLSLQPLPGAFLMNIVDLNFHVGDKVVYPNHGVGVIEQVGNRVLGSAPEKFYLLSIKASGLRVTVPCHSVGNVGLRRVARNGEVQKVLALLSTIGTLDQGDWKDRYNRNSERMRSGLLLEIAAVLKDLVTVHQIKPLSFREKKMLERARYLLVSELSMSRNCEEVKIEELLSESLAKCKLRFPEASDFAA